MLLLPPPVRECAAGRVTISFLHVMKAPAQADIIVHALPSSKERLARYATLKMVGTQRRVVSTRRLTANHATPTIIAMGWRTRRTRAIPTARANAGATPPRSTTSFCRPDPRLQQAAKVAKRAAWIISGILRAKSASGTRVPAPKTRLLEGRGSARTKKMMLLRLPTPSRSERSALSSSLQGTLDRQRRASPRCPERAQHSKVESAGKNLRVYAGTPTSYQGATAPTRC